MANSPFLESICHVMRTKHYYTAAACEKQTYLNCVSKISIFQLRRYLCLEEKAVKTALLCYLKS